MTEKTTILLVDDDLDFLESQKQLLVAAGYDVHTACTGKEGVEKAKSLHPHLILLDVMMPGMDGFEVLKKLKENVKTASIPVIMLTAKADDESKMRAAGLYGDDYLIKPVEFKTLKARIDSVLESKGLK